MNEKGKTTRKSFAQFSRMVGKTKVNVKYIPLLWHWLEMKKNKHTISLDFFLFEHKIVIQINKINIYRLSLKQSKCYLHVKRRSKTKLGLYEWSFPFYLHSLVTQHSAHWHLWQFSCVYVCIHHIISTNIK